MENNSNTTNKFRTPVLDRVSVPNVVIIGGTASGKSTVGYQLAQILDFGVVDVDESVEVQAGRPIHQIFKDEGDLGFRDLEAGVIESIKNIGNHVVITGAGAVLREENWQLLKAMGPLVWLATPLEEVVRRLVMKPDELSKRPLLADSVLIEDREERAAYIKAKLHNMTEERRHRYEEAQLTLSCSYVTAETCARFIKSKLLEYRKSSDVRDS